MSDRVSKQDIVAKQTAWLNSDYAQCCFLAERAHLEAAAKHAASPKTLQIGSVIDQSVIDRLELPFIVRIDHDLSRGANLAANPAFLPFAAESFDAVVMPHVLEANKLPHQVLREVHRVLEPDGHLVLSAFNPWSFVGLQRMMFPRLAFPGRYYTPGRVVDWLKLLGFEVVSCEMHQYAPLTKSHKLKSALTVWEKIGRRWLPMLGGGYIITARKRVVEGALVGKLQFKRARPKLASATARTSLTLNKNRPTQ